MGYASKEALLGASDIQYRDVELPTLKMTVKVRTLPAAFSNQASSDAVKVTTDVRGRQSIETDTALLEALQVLHGLAEPKLQSIEEAQALSQQIGPAWHKIVQVIRDLSGIGEEDVEDAGARFPDGGSSETPAGSVPAISGDGRPDLHLSAGVGARNTGR